VIKDSRTSQIAIAHNP